MELKQILVKYWGYAGFRPLQEDIIRSVLKGNDTLALLPTGGGKSICYQIPALATDGICLVVSPLIALMRDQVERLNKMGIKAFAVFSGMHYNEIEIALNNAMYGGAKFLYVSPERLSTPNFREALKQMKVNLLAVDEAHCISQWGYDFRPPYLKIAEIRTILPDVPILAVTASATPGVVDDIQEKLLFKNKNVLRKSFERKNLIFMVFEEEDKLSRLVRILNRTKGSGIVYIRNRRKTYEIARHLSKNNISADYYHAGLDAKKREQRQKRWMAGEQRIMVATNAFGLGIDKPDVRIVVHMDITDSIESYFQEAGRAGRDSKKSYAVLLYQKSDIINAENQLQISFPEIETIKAVYQALGNYFRLALGSGKNISFDFDIIDFSFQYGFKPITIYNSLKFLEKEGYLILSEGVHFPPKLHFNISSDDVYKFRVENVRFDGFIKIILRSYSDLFTHYVKINENEIAKRCELKPEQVTGILEHLHKIGIITYTPSKNKPQLTFTEERLDSKDLYISDENYALRKKAAFERLNTVEKYISSTNKCRSLFLLSYFGETETKRCGNCDVCIRRNKIELSEMEFDVVLEHIKPLLKQQPQSIDDIVASVKKVNEDKVMRVLRWLLDNDKIKYTKDKKIIWN